MKAITNKLPDMLQVNWSELEFIQESDFKSLSKDAYLRLKESIVEDGFQIPFFVWETKKENYCCDGYHRIAVLNELISEGYEIPEDLPAIYIQANNKKEASEIVLKLSSQYAETTPEGLYKFIEENKLNKKILSKINPLKGTMKGFEKGFYTENPLKEKRPKFDVIISCDDQDEADEIIDTLKEHGLKAKKKVRTFGK